MATHGVAVAGGGRGRGSRSTGGRILGRGASDDHVVRRPPVIRAALRLKPGLQTPDIIDQHPEIVPPMAPNLFMRRIRDDLTDLRRQLEDERLRGAQLEEQFVEHSDGVELSENPANLDYEEEEEGASEEEYLWPEEEEDSADEQLTEEVQQPAAPVQSGRGTLRRHGQHDDRRGRSPHDESINHVEPPQAERMVNPTYEDMARRLREMEPTERERDIRLKKVEKDMRAQRGEESEDELEALKNPSPRRCWHLWLRPDMCMLQ